MINHLHFNLKDYNFQIQDIHHLLYFILFIQKYYHFLKNYELIILKIVIFLIIFSIVIIINLFFIFPYIKSIMRVYIIVFKRYRHLF